MEAKAKKPVMKRAAEWLFPTDDATKAKIAFLLAMKAKELEEAWTKAYVYAFAMVPLPER